MADFVRLPPSRSVVIDRFLRACLESKAVKLPVVLLWSGRGDDGNELFDTIWRSCSGYRPCAQLDLSARPSAQPHQVLAAVLPMLCEKVSGYERLSFPRFLLGLVAIGTRATAADGGQTASTLQNVVASRNLLRGETRKVLWAVINAVGAVRMGDLGAPPLPAGNSQPLVDGVENVVGSIGRHTRKCLQWYQDNLDRDFNSHDDALEYLRRAWDSRRDYVEGVLCSAFLADLRAAYTPGRFTGTRADRPIVLLERADNPAGERLVKLIAKVRHAELLQGRADGVPDQLLVMAAGHTRYLQSSIGNARSPMISDPRAVSYQAWNRQRTSPDAGAEAMLLAVELPDLDANDRETVLGRFETTPQAADVALAERLTGGHPWGFTYVLRALAAARRAHASFDPRMILELADPDGSGRRSADVILDRLLDPLDESARETLVTWSAAVDLGVAARWQARAGTETEPSPALTRFIRADVMVRAGVLHPFLRRVLLNGLASRLAPKPWCWQPLHHSLSEHPHPGPVMVQYHRLAGGDIASAVAYLDGRLDEVDAPAWLAELHTVTSAPRPGAAGGPAPREQVPALIRSVDGDQRLARLVAARWISADPLGDPTGSLNAGIAANLDQLADRAGEGADSFHDLANCYREGPVALP